MLAEHGGSTILAASGNHHDHRIHSCMTQKRRDGPLQHDAAGDLTELLRLGPGSRRPRSGTPGNDQCHSRHAVLIPFRRAGRAEKYLIHSHISFVSDPGLVFVAPQKRLSKMQAI